LVLLKFLGRFFYCTLLLSFNAVADNTTSENNVSLTDKIEAINYNLLELDTQLDLGMDAFEINLETLNIRDQLLYFEYQLGTPRGGDQHWNESELMILNAKKKLLALEEKVKLEGDWGKVRLKLDPKEQYQKVNLKYNYGF